MGSVWIPTPLLVLFLGCNPEPEITVWVYESEKSLSPPNGVTTEVVSPTLSVLVPIDLVVTLPLPSIFNSVSLTPLGVPVLVPIDLLTTFPSPLTFNWVLLIPSFVPNPAPSPVLVPLFCLVILPSLSTFKLSWLVYFFVVGEVPVSFLGVPSPPKFPVSVWVPTDLLPEPNIVEEIFPCCCGKLDEPPSPPWALRISAPETQLGLDL